MPTSATAQGICSGGAPPSGLRHVMPEACGNGRAQTTDGTSAGRQLKMRLVPSDDDNRARTSDGIARSVAHAPIGSQETNVVELRGMMVKINIINGPFSPPGHDSLGAITLLHRRQTIYQVPMGHAVRAIRCLHTETIPVVILVRVILYLIWVDF